MTTLKIESIRPFIYIVLGIDAHEHDQVLSVSRTFEDAKEFLQNFLGSSEYFDLWIEKHPLI